MVLLALSRVPAATFKVPAARSLATSRPLFVKVGDKIPSVALDNGGPSDKVNLAELFKGKKAVLVGLPGAFTPVCSSKHVPGYLAKINELKAKGIQEIVVVSVNDGFVMKAWEKDQHCEGKIRFLADTRSALAKSLDLVFDPPAAMEALGNPRIKRFSLLAEDGVVKALNVAGEDGAPDEVTFAEKMLEQA